ncbi:aspartate/glutamate racemase family protein [Caulobacter sp. NIBR2454]|uniref:aspartate/glutamate racemase family protein n=1 Tax=Caulobacter sp. NIBR2454 TaxID=3015996 RepID=UPI0022B6EA7E|nr:amino acid racemase [Caulobacter sp. NIBR2454]
MSKILGVIGGMGPAATVDFLAKLQAATPAARDQDHVRVLMDMNPQVPDRNTGGEAGPVLGEMAVRLRDAGAQVLAMPCNTAHAYAPDIKVAGLPFIDMIKTAGEAASAAGAARPGVLGTPSALALYRGRLASMGLEPVLLHPETQARFMELLYRIKGGDLTVGGEMAALAGALIDDGADAVIAGCTEVPLVIGAQDVAVPLIDATEALARRCVEACLA